MRGALKHLDAPYDFSGRVELRQLERMDATGGLVYLTPSLLARELERTSAIHELAADTAEALAVGEPFRFERPLPELNLRAIVDFPDVERSTDGPAREITLEPPGLTGYAPEAVFDNVFAKVRKKPQKRQAGDTGAEAVRLLPRRPVDERGRQRTLLRGVPAGFRADVP